MQDAKPSLFARDDTFLGVCEGLGDDFGINPLWPRMVFTLAMFWNPVVAVSVYLALGVVVFGVRWFIPSTAPAATPTSRVAGPPVHAGNDQAAVPTALAA